MRSWHDEKFNVVFSAEQIRQRVAEMGEEITRDYEKLNQPLVLAAMLRGSLYFVADLSRAIHLPLTFDFIGIGSYSQTRETGAIRITKDLDIDIGDKHVLVLEEIVRTGLTTNYMLQNLETRRPASLSLAALIANKEQQLIELPLKYVGFQVGYQRVLGYGMDYQDIGRNLPYICELEREKLLEAAGGSRHV